MARLVKGHGAAISRGAKPEGDALEHGHGRRSLLARIVEAQHRLMPQRRSDEENSPFHHLPTRPRHRPHQRERRLCATVDWYPPNLGLWHGSFRVINKLAVQRLERRVSAALGYLKGRTACRWNLPDLPVAGARRSEVNPFAVVRPAGTHTVKPVRCQSLRRAAVQVHADDLAAAWGGDVENHGLAVGRPPRRACPAHGAQLEPIAAITVADPDLQGSRTIGHIRESLAVGGELRSRALIGVAG